MTSTLWVREAAKSSEENEASNGIMDLPTRTMMTLIAMTAKSDRDAVSRLQKVGYL